MLSFSIGSFCRVSTLEFRVLLILLPMHFCLCQWLFYFIENNFYWGWHTFLIWRWECQFHVEERALCWWWCWQIIWKGLEFFAALYGSMFSALLWWRIYCLCPSWVWTWVSPMILRHGIFCYTSVDMTGGYIIWVGLGNLH